MGVHQRRMLGRVAVYAYVVLLCLFLLAPIAIVVLVSFQEGRYLAFPVERYSLKWYTTALLAEEWREALWTSLQLAVQSTVLATLIGVLAGLALHYHDFRGKQVVSAFFLSPLLMPQLLTALALLYFFAERGVSGTYNALLLGHVLISFPFVVRLILASLPSVGRSLEEAAATLGANEIKTALLVTFPLIGPAMRGGAMFAFMASFNNVLISLFLSTPTMTPLPLRILAHLEWVADPTIAAVSTVFLLVTFALLFALQKTVGLELVPGMRTK